MTVPCTVLTHSAPRPASEILCLCPYDLCLVMHRWQTSVLALSPPLHSLHLSEMLKSEARRAARTSSNLWLGLLLSHNHVTLASSAQLPAPLFSLLSFLPHPSLHSLHAALVFSSPSHSLPLSPPSSRIPDLSRCIGDCASCVRSSCSAQHTLPRVQTT